MATRQEQALRQQQMSLAKMMFIAGALLLVGSTYMWFTRVHGNTTNVFWGMVDASLRSYGRTTSSSQSDTAQALDQQQASRLQLGQQNVVVGRTRLSQNQGTDNAISITTDNISTREANYVHYNQIEVAGKDVHKNFDELTSVWAKDENPPNGSSAFIQGLFGALGQVPSANLSKSQRKELIDYMKSQKVFTIQRAHKDFRNGRPVAIYDISVTMDRYVAMLQKFDAIMGLDQLKNVDPSQFAGQQPITMNFVIDTISRNTIEFSDQSGQQKETYSGYGAYRKVELPSNTISSQELQQKLQSTLFGQ